MQTRTRHAWRAKRRPTNQRPGVQTIAGQPIHPVVIPRHGPLELPIRSLAERVAGGMKPLRDMPERTTATMRQREASPLKRAFS